MNWYLALLSRRPLPTKLVSAVFIFGSADVISQVYESSPSNDAAADAAGGEMQRGFKWDPPRTARLVLFGVGATFWLHHWWGAIETFVEKRIVKASEHHYRNAVSKVFIDQTIGAPIFNLAFFWSQSVLQGEDMSTAASTAVDRLPAVMKLHYCFWPWVHCVNFSFVGLHARLLVQNTLSVGWMAFLSNYRQRLDDGEEGLPEPESGASCSGPHHSRRPNTPTAKKTHVTAAAATATTSTTA